MSTATLERNRAVKKQQNSSLFRPLIALYDSDDSFTAVLQMSGIDNKSISVKVKDGILTVEGITEFTPPEKSHLKYNELRVGNYRISLNVGEQIDEDKISATYRNGLLTLVLPKDKMRRNKKISIRTD
jgi:HSP20 family protein